ILFTCSFAIAQTTYDGKTFGKCEVTEAALGNTGQQLSFYIAEHELRAGYGGAYERSRGRNAEQDNLNDVPTGYGLIIEVNFDHTLQFPIEPKDSVSIAYSDVQFELQQYLETKALAKQYDCIQDSQQLKDLESKTESIEDQARAIAMQMANGSISQEEGMKKIEALTNAALNAVEEEMPTMPNVEEKDPTRYSIVFTDTKEKIEGLVFSGTLNIIRFNEEVFEAEFSGQHMVSCLEKRAASSKEEEEICRSKTSNFLPDTQLLEEGPVRFTIKANLIKFDDFR
ncbi:MAG: hypothetical protein AAF598_14755, partial [Bacteroidota bacterium]